MICHPEFVAMIAAIYKPRLYLELGLSDGDTFEMVRPHCHEVIGVDKKPQREIDDCQVMTTDDFFLTFDREINMAFIDADHKFPSVEKDLLNVLRQLAPGGIVIMHDTDPDKDELINPRYCGDAYKIVDMVEGWNDVNIVTLPVSTPGLSMLTKKGNTRKQRRDQ